jgi:hypothetical protein
MHNVPGQTASLHHFSPQLQVAYIYSNQKADHRSLSHHRALLLLKMATFQKYSLQYLQTTAALLSVPAFDTTGLYCNVNAADSNKLSTECYDNVMMTGSVYEESTINNSQIRKKASTNKIMRWHSKIVDQRYSNAVRCTYFDFPGFALILDEAVNHYSLVL